MKRLTRSYKYHDKRSYPYVKKGNAITRKGREVKDVLFYEQGAKDLKNNFNKGLVAYTNEKVRILSKPLEALRRKLQKVGKEIGQKAYFFKIFTYPHLICRHHKLIAGVAGADRLSSGMRKSFGKQLTRSTSLLPSGTKIVYFAHNSVNQSKVKTKFKKCFSGISCKIKFMDELITL